MLWFSNKFGKIRVRITAWKVSKYRVFSGLYTFRMQGKKRTRKNSEFGHFLRSAKPLLILVLSNYEHFVEILIYCEYQHACYANHFFLGVMWLFVN